MASRVAARGAHLRSAEKSSSGIARGSMNLFTVSYTAGALLPDTKPALAKRRPTNVDTRGPLNSFPTLCFTQEGFGAKALQEHMYM